MRHLAWLAAWAAARAAPDEATLLARAAALDRWFREGVPPTAWRVSTPADVPQPWREVRTKGVIKQVHRASVGGAPVVVKTVRGSEHRGTIRMELLYLESLGENRASPSSTAPGSTGRARRTSSATAARPSAGAGRVGRSRRPRRGRGPRRGHASSMRASRPRARIRARTGSRGQSAGAPGFLARPRGIKPSLYHHDR